MKTLHNQRLVIFCGKISACLLLLTVLLAAAAQPAAACARRPMTSPYVLLSMDETMSGSQTIAVTNLIGDVPGFGGTWWYAHPSRDMESVVFGQLFGTGDLPTNTEVALVTVDDPVLGTTQQFLLGTDGGAVILILGDF